MEKPIVIARTERKRFPCLTEHSIGRLEGTETHFTTCSRKTYGSYSVSVKLTRNRIASTISLYAETQRAQPSERLACLRHHEDSLRDPENHRTTRQQDSGGFEGGIVPRDLRAHGSERYQGRQVTGSLRESMNCGVKEGQDHKGDTGKRPKGNVGKRP